MRGGAQTSNGRSSRERERGPRQASVMNETLKGRFFVDVTLTAISNCLGGCTDRSSRPQRPLPRARRGAPHDQKTRTRHRDGAQLLASCGCRGERMHRTNRAPSPDPRQWIVSRLEPGASRPVRPARGCAARGARWGDKHMAGGTCGGDTHEHHRGTAP